VKTDLIRIATRSSKLALWQAEEVKKQLQAQGARCELTPIESTGDIHLTQPIYAMGVSGVFTKQLDIALLDGTADIAVHSLKDVPTQLAEGLTLAAVLPRGSHEDVLLVKSDSSLARSAIKNQQSAIATIATGSLRRIAQWRSKYPAHKTMPIRGNVQTRIKKFNENKSLDGVIFAKAGLERIGLLPHDAIVLDWMVPAPAQGIVGIICRADDTDMIVLCAAINHEPTYRAGYIERAFLNTLMGGCSVPISAYAYIDNDGIHFTGALHSFDGSRAFIVKKTVVLGLWKDAGKTAANELLQQEGAKELLEEIRNKKWSDESTID
jgi:hydroxymethylbilane synthase